MTKDKQELEGVERLDNFHLFKSKMEEDSKEMVKRMEKFEFDKQSTVIIEGKENEKK